MDPFWNGTGKIGNGQVNKKVYPSRSNFFARVNGPRVRRFGLLFIGLLV